jgi:hypothetical protein
MNSTAFTILFFVGAAAPMVGLRSQEGRPFTGTVVNADGKPVAGLVVRCDWVPNLVQPGQPDRRTATADTSGAFELPLQPVRSYCVWACGPAEDGKAWAIEPQFVGVAGRNVQLTAKPVLAPGPLRIRGLAAWRDAGPLRLRIWGSRSSVVGEVKLKEDGFHELPALPTADLFLELLAADGRVLHQESIDVRLRRELDVGDVVTANVEVVDDQGNAVAGAAVFESSFVAHAVAPPLTANLPSLASAPPLATTDEHGRAVCKLRRPQAEALTALFAVHRGSTGPVSGWMLAQPFGGARRGAGNDVFDVRLFVGRTEPHTVTFRRPNVPGDVSALLQAMQPLQAKDQQAAELSGAILRMSASQPLADGSARARPVPGDDLRWRLGAAWVGADATPCTLGITQRCRSAEHVVAASDLREVLVHTTHDKGQAVPFGTMGIARAADAGVWEAITTTGASGQARVLCTNDGCFVYCTADDAHGFAQVPAGEQRVTIVMTPFVNHEVTVKDSGGAPVVGASLLVEPSAEGSTELMFHALGAIPDPFRGKVTDARGVCSARLPAEIVAGCNLVVVVGGKATRLGPLRTATFVMP